MSPDPDLFLVITSHGIGDREPDLGETAMGSSSEAAGVRSVSLLERGPGRD